MRVAALSPRSKGEKWTGEWAGGAVRLARSAGQGALSRFVFSFPSLLFLVASSFLHSALRYPLIQRRIAQPQLQGADVVSQCT